MGRELEAWLPGLEKPGAERWAALGELWERRAALAKWDRRTELAGWEEPVKAGLRKLVAFGEATGAEAEMAAAVFRCLHHRTWKPKAELLLGLRDRFLAAEEGRVLRASLEMMSEPDGDRNWVEGTMKGEAGRRFLAKLEKQIGAWDMDDLLGPALRLFAWHSEWIPDLFARLFRLTARLLPSLSHHDASFVLSWKPWGWQDPDKIHEACATHLLPACMELGPVPWDQARLYFLKGYSEAVASGVLRALRRPPQSGERYGTLLGCLDCWNGEAWTAEQRAFVLAQPGLLPALLHTGSAWLKDTWDGARQAFVASQFTFEEKEAEALVAAGGILALAQATEPAIAALHRLLAPTAYDLPRPAIRLRLRLFEDARLPAALAHSTFHSAPDLFNAYRSLRDACGFLPASTLPTHIHFPDY